MSDIPRRFAPGINPRCCVLCRRCLARCAFGALSMSMDAAVVDTALCQACGACASACRTGAITLEERG